MSQGVVYFYTDCGRSGPPAQRSVAKLGWGLFGKFEQPDIGKSTPLIGTLLSIDIDPLLHLRHRGEDMKSRDDFECAIDRLENMRRRSSDGTKLPGMGTFRIPGGESPLRSGRNLQIGRRFIGYASSYHVRSARNTKRPPPRERRRPPLELAKDRPT